MVKPSFCYERKAYKEGYDLVIGVDEVGRGALAGPVVAAAVALDKDFNWKPFGINDSKKLSAKKRETLAKIIKKHALWGIGEVGVAFINRHGIVAATAKAMRQAIENCKLRIENWQKDRIFLLVDAFHVKYIPDVGLKNQQAIIKGDQKSLSIAAASIIAKVYRDRLMDKLYNDYKGYNWARNKGYGTARHQEAIKKFGRTRFHRLAFLTGFDLD